MNRPTLLYRSLNTLILVSMLHLSPLASCVSSGTAAVAQIPAARPPTEVVREFYKALREKRFREAFAMSVYRPAVETLSAEEFAELRPDFEKIAGVVPEKIEVSGEQISGDTATVFGKFTGEDASGTLKPVTLLRAADGTWILGDKESQEAIKGAGKDFFFKVRIETHHTEVHSLLRRIATAQFIYNSQHGGAFADLATLIQTGLVPQDVQTTESTGYRFHLTLGKNGKGYKAGAEPVRHGRTGLLSFYMDQSGEISGKDTGGKPYKGRPAKK